MTPLSPQKHDHKQQTFQDALKALINLGYNHSAAQKALKKSLKDAEDLELSALISASLKHF
jgi:Holliday junction resolvasome RuvABC DNA-binding subunit